MIFVFALLSMLSMLLLLCHLPAARTQSILTNLRDQAYDLNQRPRTDFRSPTNITLQIHLFKLSNIDSMKQSFDVGLFLRETWFDLRLANHGSAFALCACARARRVVCETRVSDVFLSIKRKLATARLCAVIQATTEEFGSEIAVISPPSIVSARRQKNERTNERTNQSNAATRSGCPTLR